MDGVHTFHGGGYSFRPASAELTPEATLVASWSDGVPLVATRNINGVQRVDLGFFPPSATVGGSGFWDPATDGALLMANALAWAGSDVRWMRAYPLSGTVPVGDSMIIEMLLDATSVGSGDYAANLKITSNDYLKPELMVPANLCVRDPGMVCDVFVTWPTWVLGTFTEEQASRPVPTDPQPDSIAATSFWLQVLFCHHNRIAVGDSAEVYVDINQDGTFAESEQYPAVVKAEDGGDHQLVAIRVFMGTDLGSGYFPVAIRSIGNISLKLEDGQPVELGRESVAEQAGEILADLDQQGSVRRYELLANYPNPFNAGTQIFFNLAETGPVTLKIYDILGREVQTLIQGTQDAGRHEVRWNGLDSHGRQVPSGIYFYRLATRGFVQSRKMVVIR
jgi:hypothetical protein